MKTETIQALTRISEIEALLKELADENRLENETYKTRRAELDGELAALWETVHADGITRTRGPRKGEAKVAKKRGAAKVGASEG